MRNNLLAPLMIVFLFVTACTAPTQIPEVAQVEPAGDTELIAPTPPTAVTGEERPEVAAEAGMTDLDALVLHPWQWVAYSSPQETFDVAIPASYLLLFNTDGIVDITADCNTAIASYGVASLDAGSLSMTVAPKTTATCPPESRGDQFLTLLAAASAYSYVDGHLHIDLTADEGTMIFAPAE